MDPTATRRRFVQAAGTLFAGVSLAGCGGDSDNGDGSGATVNMTDDLTFEPGSVTVAVGETVTWENVGTVGHTVTAYEDGIPDDATYFASGGFDSEEAALDGYNSNQEGNLEGGETYSHTFETSGTHEYYCIPHEGAGMTGTVDVEEN